MLKKIIAAITFLMLVSSANVQAKDLNVVVKLKSIQVANTSEKLGDELYFSVSEYSTKSEPQIFRVPMFPLHWLTKELDRVKDINLWQGTVPDGQAVLLIISLLEQDLVPWDVDDHLGSAQVKLANNKGKLSVSWGQPNFVDQPKVEQPDAKQPKFIMFGDKGKYTTQFAVEVGK